MAPKHAQSIGMSCVKLPVSSVTRTMPVTGALTTAVKKAAIPTMTQDATPRCKFGSRSEQTVANNRPTCAPTVNMGANNPPGVPAA